MKESQQQQQMAKINQEVISCISCFCPYLILRQLHQKMVYFFFILSSSWKLLLLLLLLLLLCYC